MVEGIYDAITGFCKIVVAIIDIIKETFNASMALLSDLPDYITSISQYFELLPDEIKVFGYMMFYILIVFTVIKIINLVVPCM